MEEGEVRVEATLSAEARRGLAARGQILVEADPLDFGASQIVRRIEHGYVVGSESRRDGCVAGF